MKEDSNKERAKASVRDEEWERIKQEKEPKKTMRERVEQRRDYFLRAKYFR